MDCVMVVADDEWGWRNEAGRLYSKDWVIVILREEDDGGRVMVMTNECDQEAEERSGYGDM